MILRIGFEKVGYEYNAREILANSIAKYLLNKARSGTFKNDPIVLFVDEAHQYLNKSLKDDQLNYMELNAFDQIAKECRKYGLFLCIATQMPRDIPVGTLSQMGTFIVHRLINFYDKEAIASACSSANSGILSFLPVLGEGEAILTGVDIPMPVSIKIIEPEIRPDSRTPLFKINR
ncbi:ATP-binding protein [Paenibacillus solanacearum]|uniref:ATP-binding protein n=1 Tax=Paenibacillus solanacearum TaxID=2048548 RepID=UPI001FE29544|nr:ATP-binding protein [Paenibacillus solanacearum]